MMDPSTSQQLGKNLAALRAAAGLTQHQVAQAAGLTLPHYAALESGKSSSGRPANPRLDTLLNLARALSAHPADLIAGLHQP
jgi:transcriptional regulator with XRE-family HTH domain